MCETTIGIPEGQKEKLKKGGSFVAKDALKNAWNTIQNITNFFFVKSK